MSQSKSVEWHLARDGQQYGPVSDDEFQKLIEGSHLLPTDLVWREGMAEWAPATKVLALPAAIPGSPAANRSDYASEPLAERFAQPEATQFPEWPAPQSDASHSEAPADAQSHADSHDSASQKRPLHTQWQELDPAAKAQFLTDQRRFSKEEFSPSHIDLSAVPLSFMPGYRLVRAILMPQVVQMANGASIEIEETHVSFFLYNNTTDNVTLMTIPLQPNSAAIYIANRLLKIRLTKDTVVDYVKYFGLIVEGESQHGFFFFDHESEIPWTAEIDEKSRQKLLGMLAARSPIGENGAFDVQLTEEKSWPLGSVFRLTIPCIYDETPFSTRMSVTPTGAIAMDDDNEAEASGAVENLARKLPYYSIEPTAEFKSKFWWWQLRVRAGVIVGLIGVLAFVLFSIVGLAISLMGIVDVLVGGRLPGVSEWINGFLRGHPNLLSHAVIGSILNLLFSAIVGLVLWAGEAIGQKRPGVLQYLFQSYQDSLRKRYPSHSARIRGVITHGLTNAITVFVSWGCIFYALDALGWKVFEPMQLVDLRSSIGFAFEQALGWFTRGSDGLFQPLFGTFKALVPTSPLGSGLCAVMLASIPILLIWNVKRFWRLTRPDEAENQAT